MKILLAMDTSSASQAALTEVSRRPWADGSSFEILSVIEPSHVISTVDGARQAVHRVNKLVEDAAERLRLHGWEASGGAVVDDNPKIVIVDCARRMGADLVVVGSHGRSDLQRFLLGSVASWVARRAPCSIEIVRANPLSDETSRPMKILLAVDGSSCSELATASVADRPWPDGTEVRVLCVPELELAVMPSLSDPLFLSSMVANARLSGAKSAQGVVERALETLPHASVAMVRSAEPKRAILEEALDWHAGLIVVGSHGRRGAESLLMGSVSEAVALHSPCSVEIIRNQLPS